MARLRLITADGGSAGDFDRLVRPHYETLYRVAFRFTGSQQDAEDLVQETCLRACRHLGRLAEVEKPCTWLLCVMRRLFIDQRRSYAYEHVRGFGDGYEEQYSSGDPGPAERTESALTARRLGRSWRKLGREQRMLLALHDVEGYSLAEIGEVTGLKIGTIKSRLHRARVKLGRLLETDRRSVPAGAPRRAKS